MMDDIFPYARKCRKCGKTIFPNPSWAYQKNGKYFCTWKCYREYEREMPKRKVLLPKVGDTIEIIYVSGIPSLTGKIGVVQFYDSMGQMHGTWNSLVIVPGEDKYRIIGEVNKNEE